MRTDVTFLGLVQRVVGARILVEISEELPSASPIIDGRVHRLGQVGSFVRIPLGFLSFYGVVSQVGASELAPPTGLDPMLTPARRWLEVQLVGESYANEGFQRGVSVFPTLDDEVHVVTERDLALIYGATGPSMLKIGSLAASESLPASMDLDRIVTRHTAILGSTGTGKSNSVAGFLKALTGGAYPSARVVVIDPHGEYRAALRGRACVYSIGDPDYPLTVPYWALSFDELAWFLVDRRSATESVQDSVLRDHIFRQKQECCEELQAGAVESGEITVDSPIPFSVRQLWYELDRAQRVTYQDMGRTDEALVEEGNVDTLTPAEFEPPGAGSSPPFKPAQTPVMGSYVKKILGRIRDRRFEFLLAPGKCDGRNEDLHHLLGGWIDNEHSITVLDLAGVPFEVMDIVVGVVTRIMFEAMFWGRNLPGIGKQRPLLIVYEEAHAYLPRGGASQFVSGYAASAVRRVFREGRKYGVGAMVVSQRPSDLDETILSQCGTFIALRLTNSDDQARVRSTVPDSLAGLVDLLPALRTGEALILGEAVQIPSRVRFPLVDPRPASDDPEVVKCWRRDRIPDPHYDLATTGWREQRTPSEENGDCRHG
jgi:DNA helicase HerA-like ATPase